MGILNPSDEPEWVGPRDFYVACTGFSLRPPPGSTAKGVPGIPWGTYYPFTVVKNKRFNFAYSWLDDYPDFLPLAPVGIATIPGLAQSFIQQHLLPQVQQISQVQNLYLIQKNNEAYQVYHGVSPSWLRVYPEQPTNVPTYTMDQNINLSSSFYDEGWFDGYDSPYNDPRAISELGILAGVEPSYSLVNPWSWLTNPVFKLFLNRLELAPVTDEEFARNICLGSVPRTHFVNIGDPTQATAGGFDTGSYPNVLEVTVPSTRANTPTAGAARHVAPDTTLPRGGY
ncbi:MAG: hypothetical protein ACREB9_02820 [Thermoplasmata archaeon]